MNEAGNITISTSAAKLMTPIYHMDPYLSTIHIGFASIGIPLNLLVAGTIAFNRQLQATQNIAWLGIGFANVFTLAGFLVEVAAAREDDTYFFLPLYEAIVGLPATSLILYLTLSLLDRRFFFRYTAFYKKYVTNPLILAIQLTCFVLIVLAIKGPIFFPTLTQSCKHILNAMDFAQAFSSVFVGILTLYIPYKKYQETNTAQRSIIANDSHNTSSRVESDKDNKFGQDEGIAKDNQPRFSRSELQSFYSVRINVKVFLIFITTPLVLLLFSILCLLIAIIDEYLFNSCSNWFGTTFYLRGIFKGFYTAMFNPLCFVGHSHDFFELVKRSNPIGGIARATSRLTNWPYRPKASYIAVVNS